MKSYLHGGAAKLRHWASAHPEKSHALNFSFTCLAFGCMSADTPASWTVLLGFVFVLGLIMHCDLRKLRPNPRI